MLLYGISLGSDPDVYAYWHSSQARPGGLNFSEWKSSRADLNLELGRSRLNLQSRAARYNDFLDEWQKQAPAIALYRPRMNYSFHQYASGMEPFSLNTTAQRFSNVYEWTVNTRRVHLTP
jgi:peptide/nickel transport system substrate-binding protein